MWDGQRGGDGIAHALHDLRIGHGDGTICQNLAGADLTGAKLVTVPLRWPDFQPDPDELAAAVGDRTRLILVNDPHNPTGTVASREFKELLVELATEAGLDADAARDALQSGRYLADVRADQAQAQEYGIQGVPFFVILIRRGKVQAL